MRDKIKRFYDPSPEYAAETRDLEAKMASNAPESPVERQPRVSGGVTVSEGLRALEELVDALKEMCDGFVDDPGLDPDGQYVAEKVLKLIEDMEP